MYMYRKNIYTYVVGHTAKLVFAPRVRNVGAPQGPSGSPQGPSGNGLKRIPTTSLVSCIFRAGLSSSCGWSFWGACLGVQIGPFRIHSASRQRSILRMKMLYLYEKLVRLYGPQDITMYKYIYIYIYVYIYTMYNKW